MATFHLRSMAEKMAIAELPGRSDVKVHDQGVGFLIGKRLIAK